MKHFFHISFLLAVLFFMTGIQPLLAFTHHVNIQNGSSGGFGFSGIHKLGSSNFIYSLLEGRLDFDLSQTGDLLSLANINGTLIASQGKVEITGGELSQLQQPNKFASGFLDYELFDSNGGSKEAGSFTFLAKSECCSSALLDGPNHLTSEGFILWGGDGENLGIDLVGGRIIANPEPSTILLFGTGLLALPFLRRKKA